MIACCQLLVQVCLLQPEVPVWKVLWNERFGLLLLATMCVAGAGYIINDYYDVKIDAINKPQRLVVGRGINRRQAILAHLSLSGIGLVIGYVLSWSVMLIMAGAILLLWGYSAQFKKMLLVGNVVTAFLTSAMLLVVAVNNGAASKAIWAYAVFAFVISLIREIIKDMEDVKGDASFECRTLPIVAGIPATKLVLYFLLLLFYPTVVIAILYRRHDLFFGLHMVVLVLVPAFVMLRNIRRADRKRDFGRLSSWCKNIMLMGMLSMVYFR
jgi:4-hydroxybenzoate polyprenyltransferase